MKDDKEEYTKKKFKDHIEDTEPNELIDITLNFLHLLTNEDKIKYESIVMDSFLRDEYYNLVRLFYDEESILKRCEKLNKIMLNIKVYLVLIMK